MTDEQIELLIDEYHKRMRKPPMEADERSIMRGYIVSGIALLNTHAMGKDVDYIRDALGHELLYNYLFYADNDCQDKYESAYRSLLIRYRNAARLGDVREVEG